MPLSSPWFLVGFVLGAIAGTLATDLTREEVIRREKFGSWLHVQEWSRQQGLLFVGVLWVTLFFAAIISAAWPWTSAWWDSHIPGVWWNYLVLGSIIGAAAAPWVWLHFVRDFATDGDPGRAPKDVRIRERAYQIWHERGEPAGHNDEHYFQAKKEIEDSEQRLNEVPDKSAEQRLARYQLLSIVLGIALLVATLLPVLKSWLLRAQQFQVFGVSLTLATTQSSGQGRPLVTYESVPGRDQGNDRLSKAIDEAYKIGAADPKAPFASLRRIGPDLQDFGNLR
jgi:hypothetical protein